MKHAVKTERQDNWCADFFDEAFADHYLERAPQHILAAVGFLTRHLQLAPGSRIFDQCCGVGNVSHALARMGHQLTGVDLIPGYIARAKKSAVAKDLSCDFYADDARVFKTPAPCDAAFNWWTSFGYFEDDAENRRMMERAADSLKTGGLFVLDYMNRAERIASFGDKDVLVAQTPEGRWESIFDRARDMVVKSWIYRDAAGNDVAKNGSGAKLYSPAQLQRLLEQAGFKDVEFRGDWSGGPLTATSPRCIAIARKA